METRKITSIIFVFCVISCSFWTISNDPSFEVGGYFNYESTSFSPLPIGSSASKDLRPPTREELEQAALTLVSAQHYGIMKSGGDLQTFINKVIHANDEVRDQQNGGIVQDSKIGFITLSKVIDGELDGDGNKTFRCELQIRQPSRIAPSKVGNVATFVLFQSNGGHQLQRFVSHHSKVIGMENIVIIDHQADRSLADSHTALLLEKYNNHGSDVWGCDGSFKYKENMWSQIIHQYQEASEFVFPLDVDELIAVKTARKLVVRNETNHHQHSNYKETEELSWNADAFKNALIRLPNSEKPFKIEQGLTLPTDCGNIQWNTSLYSDVINHDFDPLGFTNNVKHVGRRRPRESSCLDKAFFRSQDFYSTDAGNHIGQTHRYKDNWRKNCTETVVSNYVPGIGWRNETIGRHDPDQKSDLYMMHFQQVNFAEWLIHALRGAADDSFNTLSQNEANDCSTQLINVHYCTGWEKLKKAMFDPKEMKKIYRKEVCSLLVDHHYPLPVGHLF